MRYIVGTLTVIAILIALSASFLFSLSELTENSYHKELARGRSESEIIHARSMARMDAAVISRMEAEAASIVKEAEAQAQALKLNAEIEARALDRESRAAVQSTLLAAALPWGGLVVLGVLGISALALAVTMLFISRVNKQAPQRVIVYLPSPGQTRRDVWNSAVEVIQPAALQRKND